MILLIDNYDSFSYNLYQLIGKIDGDIKIIRNDELSIEEIINMNQTVRQQKKELRRLFRTERSRLGRRKAGRISPVRRLLLWPTYRNVTNC